MMNVRDLIRELEKFPADMDVMLPVGYTFDRLETVTDVDVHSVFFAPSGGCIKPTSLISLTRTARAALFEDV
jgi:protoheme ferro-lyase